MTNAEQAAVDYLADALSGASAVQIAKSLETAEFYFRDVSENERRQAIIDTAARIVAASIQGTLGPH